MLEYGNQLAQKKGFQIDSVLGDAHCLPFPDNYFDVVTLSWASRHLRVIDAFAEIRRVLKHGGYFYHCDMLRPNSKIVGELYFTYLKICLPFVALIFRSGPDAVACKDYFIRTLRMFYSSDELSELLSTSAYSDISSNSIFGGMIAFHKACKI
jgi:demethylmenaquinone methyltransferase/2-methoxy-6-polyprenyl-1,4-benzoquinol methylase